MATLEALHGLRLVGWQDLGLHFVDAEPARDGLGDRPRVPGDHGDLEAHRMQEVDRLARLRPDLVLDGERTEDPAIGDDVEHRLPVRRPLFGPAPRS